MKRRIYKVAALVSLMCCVSATFVWLRTINGWSVLEVRMGRSSLAIGTHMGDVALVHVANSSGYTGVAWNPDQQVGSIERYCLFYFMGFGYVRSAGAARPTILSVTGWFVPVVLLLSTASLWHLSRRRHLAQVCHACGYDLRASKDTGIGIENGRCV